MNLIREILLWMEDQEHGYVGGNPELPEYTEEEIGYHVYLMHEAGLVVANIRNSIGPGLESPHGILVNMTWNGHEFLDAATPDLWAKAKEHVLKPATGVAFDVLKEWLKVEAKRQLGIP